ncbi:unnamed protein product [Rotaria magnacalcarata]
MTSIKSSTSSLKKLTKSENTSTHEENKENITIVYFDTRKNGKTIDRTNMLQEVNHYVLKYDNIDECLSRIQSIKKEKIIFVTTGKNLINVFSRIENIRQIDGIFIFSTKTNKYDQFNEKITGIFSNDDDMISAIRKHMKLIQDQLLSFSFYRSHQRYVRNLTDTSAEFIWFHIFKDTIIRLPHDEHAKKEMLDASRHYYRNNIQELKNINEFEQNYRSEEAIKWYTKNSFVYRLINKALRTEDVEQMYTFRYFIQDLYSALTLKHKIFKEYGESVTLYRGLRLTQLEFDEMTKDEQQLISMNGYLSTSLNPQVAKMYAGEPTLTSDKLSIILEIECDVEKLGDRVIFADVTSESTFRDENEVLFDIGATLQLVDKPKQTDNRVWYFKMIATDESRTIVRKYIDDHLELNVDVSPKMMFGVSLYNMGKYESSLAYFNKLIENPENEDIPLIHVHMARALAIGGDKNNEWKHYEIAYKILTKMESKRFEDEARVLIHMGIFYFDRDENDQALEYFTPALRLLEQIHEKPHLEIARALLCIGGCYEQKGDYDCALEFYNRSLKIHEKNADLNHITQCLALIALGNAYRLQCKYEDALVQFQQALDIRTRTLPKYHSDIADCLSLIGKTLSDMDNPSEGTMYSMRALQMYSRTLPETELNEKSSVLVDIGIGFSSVGADQLGIDYYQRALTMKKKCLQRNHPDFVAIFENMALNYSHLNKHLLALRHILKARRLRRKIQTLNHPNMAGTLKILALVYSKIGFFRRAIHYLKRSKTILEKTTPIEHPQRIDVRNQMKRIKKKIQKEKYSKGEKKRWKFEKPIRRDFIKLLSTLADINLQFCSNL